MLTRMRGARSKPLGGNNNRRFVKTTEARTLQLRCQQEERQRLQVSFLTDAAGNLVGAQCTPASRVVPEPAVFEKVRHAFSWHKHVFADAANAGLKLHASLADYANCPPMRCRTGLFICAWDGEAG